MSRKHRNTASEMAQQVISKNVEYHNNNLEAARVAAVFELLLKQPDPAETITEQKPETVLIVGTECETSIVPKPRVTSFVPSPCSSCVTMRQSGTNYTRVTSTQGNIRYCKCTFCGNTWKEQ